MMTNQPDPVAPVAAPQQSAADIMTALAEASAINKDLFARNKEVLFAALASAGIDTVNVEFDGQGDSGQISSLVALNHGTDIALPAQKIDFSELVEDKTSRGSNNTRTERRSLTLQDAIEEMVYAKLSESHGGWENDDGAFGTFVFTVAEQIIKLEYNERYTSYEYSTHEF
ncbi:MAG: hypothetical protein POH28_11905 [Acidocella sp.]|nr:hypothetical protein [Acidocella sp.]